MNKESVIFAGWNSNQNAEYVERNTFFNRTVQNVENFPNRFHLLPLGNEQITVVGERGGE